jgi:hypothetical protein
VLVVLIGRHQALVVFQKLDVSFFNREELLFQATFNWERGSRPWTRRRDQKASNACSSLPEARCFIFQ